MTRTDGKAQRSSPTTGHASHETILARALRHHQAGQLHEAELLYRQLLAARRDHPDALHLLGVIALQVGRNDVAIELIDRAITVTPGVPDFHNNLGNAFANQGKFDDALLSYQRALALRPTYAEAHSNTGNALRAQGNLGAAMPHYRRALALQPSYAEAHNNLGVALRDDGQSVVAEACFRQAVGLRPGYAEAHNNLGSALRDQDRLAEAITSYERALAIRPAYPEAHTNLGNAFQLCGQLDKAITCYRQALASAPEYAPARVDLAQALLLKGDFLEGWANYEWRWRRHDFVAATRSFPQPLWDGGNLAGRTILLHAEQGFGDTVQFVRYAPFVAARGGQVIVECQPELATLLRELPAVRQVVGRGEPLPPFDVHAPLMSLPYLLGASLATNPPLSPYLSAAPERVAHWAGLLDDHIGLKVGLVWAGNPTHQNDRRRSLSLVTMAPLGRVAGVRLFSLQKGSPAAQASTPPAGMTLTNLGPLLADFADTAAVVSLLDLIITVDTSVAHVAGATGRPTWVLLSHIPDWRWLLHRDDSPWYPTMQLFRQDQPGDWQPVIERVAARLAAVAG